MLYWERAISQKTQVNGALSPLRTHQVTMLKTCSCEAVFGYHTAYV